MRSIAGKFQRSLAIRGFMGTVKLCLLYFTSSQQHDRAVAREHDMDFDRRWGVDTGGTVMPAKSAVKGDNWVYGFKYQGIDPTALSQVLSELALPHEHFTFVDFGSGKGRAILVASSFPFRRIIGVEYSAQLNEIARKNLDRCSNKSRRCQEIKLICADAAKFPIPEGPLVLFFYNPFGRPVMAEVVQNVAASFQHNPRRIVVIYFAGLFADCWRRADFIQEVRASEWLAIYDTMPVITAEPPSKVATRGKDPA